MINSVNEREIALDILMEVNEKGQYLHVLLNDALRKFQYLEKNQRAFISRLVRGTVERRITLDYVINQVSTVQVNKMKPFVRNLIRMSVYQLMYMKQVPASAVCNEAVKLAKKRHFNNLSGFVNGVLRNIGRQLPQMQFPDDRSIQYSMPEHIVRLLIESYGEQAADAALGSFLSDSPVSVITNTDKCSVSELRERLEADNITVKPAPYIKDALLISGYNYAEDIPAFSEGLFQIQDISSMMAGVITAPKKGNRVLDVCAAPGGKSIFAALSLKGTGQVISRDISAAKVGMIEENIQRLGLKNVITQVADATVVRAEEAESADIVLADVPCSGLGIIGRKPDIKYNIAPKRFAEIRRLQRQIIDAAVTYVKSGGFIVYSTCTLNPYENEENVRYIIEKGFKPVDITDCIPKDLLADSMKAGENLYNKMKKDAEGGCITLIPGIYECDGFFVAKLKKN